MSKTFKYVNKLNMMFLSKDDLLTQNVKHKSNMKICLINEYMANMFGPKLFTKTVAVC